MDTKYVFPWCVVLANLAVQIDQRTGRRTGKSTSGLCDQITGDGFKPRKVTAIWNSEGFSGFALVEFRGDIDGLENARQFARSFTAQNLGKRDWEKGVESSDTRLYGWLAGRDDYNGRGPLANELRRSFDLKTVAQYLAGEERKRESLARSVAQMQRERKRKVEWPSDEEGDSDEGEVAD